MYRKTHYALSVFLIVIILVSGCSTIPDWKTDRMFADKCIKYRLWREAVMRYLRVLDHDPENFAVLNNLGIAYEALGEFVKAREAYERVRRLDPENINVLENLGVIFANTGDYKRAVWQWGEVLKRTPDRVDIVDRIKKVQRVIRQRCM